MYKIQLNKLSPACTEVGNFVNSVSGKFISSFLEDISNGVCTFGPLSTLLTGHSNYG
jgi:hypothetical protein